MGTVEDENKLKDDDIKNSIITPTEVIHDHHSGRSGLVESPGRVRPISPGGSPEDLPEIHHHQHHNQKDLEDTAKVEVDSVQHPHHHSRSGLGE